MDEMSILSDAIRTLGSVSVPVGLIEPIGIPIFQVRANLLALIKELQSKDNKKSDEEIDTENLDCK